MILKRKIDKMLINWKNNPNKYPLIIRGARQIGKTYSISEFGHNNYKNYIEINFIINPEYKNIFSDGYSPNDIIKNITLINSSLEFVPYKTLIFFDEIQECPNAATCLKFFKLDGRYDVICSGSMMGLNYKEIDSVSVGYKTEYTMYSLDFEEFLWAKGYSEETIENLYYKMKNVIPLSNVEMNVFLNIFHEYMVLGGMPKVVEMFITNKNYSGILELQKQILKAYEEDIRKYANGLDQAKILNTFRNIKIFLGKDNKKFQITKINHGSRNREYIGVTDWLLDSGIINICYLIKDLELPLKANYDPKNYKIYFMDTGLLVASLDEESSYDLRSNRNFNTYKGGLYENMVGDMLVKADFDLFFYKNEKSTIEMDFITRNKNYIIPIEVKASNSSTISLNKLIDKYDNIKYGIKLCENNIGFNNKFYTFPYFLTFLLKRFLSDLEKNEATTSY